MKKIAFLVWLLAPLLSYSQINHARAPLATSSDTVLLNFDQWGFDLISNVLVNRSPVFNSTAQLRLGAIADTTIIQQLTYNNVTQQYKYDPNDATSADDSVTVIVNSSGKRFKAVFNGPQVNVRLFGATGNGSTDDWASIQKAINILVAHPNLPKTLFFPEGTYSISQPLIVYSWSGTNYAFCSINLEGQEAAHFDNTVPEAVIVPTFKKTFVLGFQLVRSCLVKGLVIKGLFMPTPGSTDWRAYYNRSFSTWVSSQDTAVRDSRFSPYAGIAIDPFRNDTTHPADGGYPGLSGWYRGTGANSASGSSAVDIEDCRIYGFTTDIVVSPNGVTLNGENIQVNRCALESAKVAFAACQQQQKDNFIRNAISWNQVYALIDNTTYGTTLGQPPYVDGWNVAGDIIEISNTPSVNFTTTYSNIYAEGLYRIGTISGPVSIINSEFNFNLGPDNDTTLIPPSHLDGTASLPISFYNCTLRYYDNHYDKRPIIATSASFDHCYFGDVPIGISTYSNENNEGLSFKDCRVGSNMILGWENFKGEFTPGNPRVVAYGHIKTDEGSFNVTNSFSNSLNMSFNAGSTERSYLLSSLALTIDSLKRTGSATLNSIDRLYIAVGDYITSFQHGFFQVLGKVASVNRTTGAMTLIHCPLGSYSDTYTAFAAYYDIIGGMFVGDLTNGSNTITNIDESKFMTAPYVGERLKIGGTMHIPIIDAITTTPTLTITMSAPADHTQTGATNPFFSKDFNSDRMQFQTFDIPTVPGGSTSLTTLDILFPEGAIWVAPVSSFQTGSVDQRFVCIQSGYISPSTIGKTRQALWKNIYDVGQFDGDATANEGLSRLYYNTTSNTLRVKNGATWNDVAVNGTIPGWQSITSGSSGTVTNNTPNVLINPATALASYSLTLPAAPLDGSFVKIHFGGTIAGGSPVVTSFSLLPNAGQSITQPAAPSSASGGNCYIYQYNAGLSSWYREQ